MAAIAIGAFIEVAARVDAVRRWLHHARTTSTMPARISRNWSFEIPVLVWSMAKGQECADHDERDRRVESAGTMFLREQQCKKHHNKSDDDDRESWLASKPAASNRLGVGRPALGGRICIFGHVGIDE
jgi:hypothetical protein